MGRLFGTDGARGIAITELTCELAMQIGRAAALVLTKEAKHKAKILIGKDTRISSDILEAALCAGICSVGADAVTLGVVPTPAVAYLVRAQHADAGIMISASHNSVEFNGIKLFSATGYKLPDAVEAEIEALILDTPEKIALKSHKEVGSMHAYETAKEDYISYLASTISTPLTGLKLALDCANGSASATAQALFEKLGATVHMLSDQPNGLNINDHCGSTHMEQLMQYVKTHDCDAGLAFDGDADRMLAVDECGEVVDGDQLMSICGNYMKQKGTLKKNTIVATVMSNLGMFLMGEREGIHIEKTKVGDRYVLENMLENGYNIGGEQSGHIIFLDENTTGDGLLSALHLLQVMTETKKKLSELASIMEVLPQALVNAKVPNHKKEHFEEYAEIAEAIAEVEAKFAGEGRVLIRPSGTEPLVRVMIEGKDQQLIESEAQKLAELISSIML